MAPTEIGIWKMQKNLWTASAAALALLAPLAVHAADGDDAVTLSPIVVESATRSATPVNEVTRSVTVVTREQIEKRKLMDRNVGDILSQMVPGFSQSNEAATDYGLTLRGRTFLTMIDGVPQSTSLRDGRRGLNTISPEAIERIEVVRGGTAAYGFGAAGGLVNIITKKGAKGDPRIDLAQGFSLSATHPSDSLTATSEVSISGARDDIDYLVAGSFATRDSYFDSEGNRIPSTQIGGQGGTAETDEVNLLAKLGHDFDDARQRVQLTVNHFDLTQSPDYGNLPTWTNGAPDGYRTPALPGNPNLKEPGNQSTMLNLEYRHSEVLGSAVTSQVFYGNQTTTYGKIVPWAQSRLEVEKSGGRVTVTTPVQALVPFEIIWGGDYLQEDSHHKMIDGAPRYPTARQQAYAGFAQVEAPVSDLGRLSFGGRHERINLDVSPFVHASGNAFDGGSLTYDETLFNVTGTVFVTDHVDLFGGWSEGFTLADVVRSIGDPLWTNPNFELTEDSSEAQRTQNYEAGLRATYDRWDGSLVGFLNTSDNGTTFTGPNMAIQKSPERVWGVEVAANVRVTDALGVGGTATWIQGEMDPDNDGTFEYDLPTERVAPTKITAYAEYQVTDWWTTRLSGLYSGSREPNPGQTRDVAGFTSTQEIDSYMVFDLYNEFAVGPGTLEVGVKNLFNANYLPVLNQAYDNMATNAAAPGTTVSARYAVTF